MRDSTGIARLGTPTVVIVTEPFRSLALGTAKVAGLRSLPIVSIPHPQTGVPADVLGPRLGAVMDDLIRGLTQADGSEEAESSWAPGGDPERHLVTLQGTTHAEALRAVNRLFYENNWTDGFPVVPPTEDSVQWMLSGTDRSPDELIGLIPPANGRATVRNIAVNSVMAGAEPEYLPVIIAAIEAMVDPAFAVGEQTFGVHGLQTTTGPVSPLIVVNGPLARELKIASGYGCFSRGHKANATIGRAVRLVLTNAGGALLGVNDMKAQGSAQEFTYCCAEREEHRVYNAGSRPWQPLHVERGFSRDTSTVTVAAAMVPISIHDIEDCGPKILDRVAAALGNINVAPNTLDRDCFIILGATHAACLADAGMSKDDIREYVYANAVMPWRLYKEQYPGPAALQPRWMKYINDGSTTVNVFKGAQNFQIIVAGGDSAYSQIARVSYKSVTKEIRAPRR